MFWKITLQKEIQQAQGWNMSIQCIYEFQKFSIKNYIIV